MEIANPTHLCILLTNKLKFIKIVSYRHKKAEWFPLLGLILYIIN